MAEVDARSKDHVLADLARSSNGRNRSSRDDRSLEGGKRQAPLSRSHILVVAAKPASQFDGIHDHTVRLLASLGECDGVNASLDTRSTATIREALRELMVELFRAAGPAKGATGRHPSTVLLQYNPFHFGRWGFAPWLPVALWRMRRDPSSPQIALMVHEPYVPSTSWRTAIMSLWQRGQLRALRSLADVVLVSTEAWSKQLRGWPRRPIRHMPVGSNLPDMRSHRATERRRLGNNDDAVVLAAFGTSHPSQLRTPISLAANKLADAGIPVTVLNLGAGVSPIADLPTEAREFRPGALDAESLGRLLAAADIFLAPFADGASTRRTTLMAALQHQVACVATAGPLTDPLLYAARDAMRLVPVQDAGGFAVAVLGLAVEPASRRALAAKGRGLFESQFDWPVIAARLLAAIDLER